MRKIVTVLMLAGIGFSKNLYALDLVQLYNEALANDPVYASARYGLQAGQEAGTQGRAGLLPQIELDGGYNDVNGDRETFDVTTSLDSRTTRYAVNLTQPLFRWANWQQYQQGKLSVVLSEAEFAQARQDLILRVSQAYFDVLTAQDVLASIQTQKSAITEQLASAKRSFEVGTTTITDTQEAQARYDLTLAQEAAAINDLDVRRAALEQIIGKPAGNLATLRSDVILSGPQPAEVNHWIDRAQTQNFAVIAQELNREIASLEIKRAQAGHMPTLDLVASRGHVKQRGSTVNVLADTTSDTTSVGVELNIPLFSGFSVTSQVREAAARAERARADLENSRRSAIQSARQSFLSLNSGLAQIKALQAAEVSSRSALDSNLLGYQVGVRINIDILNAQQQLYATLRDLARARYDTLMHGLRLKAAAGILEEGDLVEVNKLLTYAPSNSMMSKPSSMPFDFMPKTERAGRKKKNN